MRVPLLLAVFVSVTVISPQALPAQTNPVLITSTIVDNLHVPWEILWGPDDRVWFTERSGRVSRVNPSSGQREILLTIGTVWEQGESGLLGMALHPAFQDTPQVFVAYTYQRSGRSFMRIERYAYAGSVLHSPAIILDNLAAGTIHNGCRLLILPDRTLLVATGNAAGDNNPASPSLDTSRLEGKILRMNLDGSIPADNPFPGSLVYTYGHRNPQGLVRLPDGTLFISEHGANTDDEVNRIVKGGNYGWPAVRGFCDQTAERRYCDSAPVVEPVNAWTPTIAPAGIDFYDHPAIPSWRNSLLLVTLKEQDLRVLRLNNSRDAIIGEIILFNNQFGRLRDVCVSPTGEIYLATSNTDGRGSPKPGDDRIVRVSPAVSEAGAEFDRTPQKGAEYTVLITGSTLKVRGPRISGGRLVLYDLRGKPVRSMFFSAAAATYGVPAVPGGAYGYRIIPDNGVVAGGIIVLPGK
ncbi:MAG: PQQ-dependent sugar dehydrogenase [Chitinispirillaceae bacterium]|nr:PQQ-dependent sugar dehydrogenase [Chitinispirillaceae bacterium]